MNLKGVIILRADGSPEAVEYVPMDQTGDEYVGLDACPAEVQRIVVSLCDTMGVTPLGVVVDLTEPANDAG